MGISRRSALKLMATTASVGVAAHISAGEAAAAEVMPLPDAVGMLYDTTKCIGCKACVVACNEANALDVDVAWSGGLYQAPLDLNANTKNIIKLYEDGSQRSFVKQQCMHCVDPACVAACMMGALKKDARGIVSWTADACVGCRYCQIACPYGIPKFEWSSYNPRIVKCELCKDRIDDGGQPACCEVCPRGAVIYGRRVDLLEEAHRRLAASPDRYVPSVYGEHDGGGTQVLYLSHVPFDRIGLPALGESSAAYTRRVQDSIYHEFKTPVLAYGLLAAAIWRNNRSAAAEAVTPPDEATR